MIGHIPGVIDHGEASWVCNVSATNFRITRDFPAVFGYPNVINLSSRENQDCSLSGDLFLLQNKSIVLDA